MISVRVGEAGERWGDVLVRIEGVRGWGGGWGAERGGVGGAEGFRDVSMHREGQWGRYARMKYELNSAVYRVLA